ncbi:ferredoxin [Mycolicibacter kumamotonensis]|jgi:ferredoxin|uniref:Ferredoxin n=1 Tax=Mycolicibacter kumamotonensis TaxID=354243 RepID=A0A1X0E794_9MYCO|nr:ferredoxin [Mycolicibacter kumamotonensis]NDJ88044.1 ferredoxin [Mycolicibacter kumamotonensis]ORA80546.1 ferredoxin [Mycolicibacter kumamotonensis]
MKAWVDPDRCAGHGICTTICPEVFAINDDGYSEVTVDEVPPQFEDAVRDAIKQCPEHAIDDVTDSQEEN